MTHTKIYETKSLCTCSLWVEIFITSKGKMHILSNLGKYIFDATQTNQKGYQRNPLKNKVWSPLEFERNPKELKLCND